MQQTIMFPTLAMFKEAEFSADDHLEYWGWLDIEGHHYTIQWIDECTAKVTEDLPQQSNKPTWKRAIENLFSSPSPSLLPELSQLLSQKKYLTLPTFTQLFYLLAQPQPDTQSTLVMLKQVAKEIDTQLHRAHRPQDVRDNEFRMNFINKAINTALSTLPKEKKNAVLTTLTGDYGLRLEHLLDYAEKILFSAPVEYDEEIDERLMSLPRKLRNYRALIVKNLDENSAYECPLEKTSFSPTESEKDALESIGIQRKFAPTKQKSKKERGQCC